MSLPRDWTALGRRLENWTPPESSFDPSGEWKQHYVRHSLIPGRDGVPGGGQVGSLHIEHTPKKPIVHLQISEVEKAGFTTLTVKAGINCVNDILLTPRRWSLNLNWQTPLEVVKPGEMDQQQNGFTKGGEIVLNTATKERHVPAPKQWTSFWNLFAAIQTLPFKAETILHFDMFESFDLHKPAQQLAYAGIHPVTTGGQTMNLHVFEQTGSGIMPWHWWLDDQHRILLAAGNRRAYLLAESVNGGAA